MKKYFLKAQYQFFMFLIFFSIVSSVLNKHVRVHLPQLKLTQHSHHRQRLDKIDSNLVVDAVTGIKYNPYSKFHPGRHVCTSQKSSATSTFPTVSWATSSTPSSSSALYNGKHNCRYTYRFICDKPETALTYFCCPGWKQTHTRSYNCNIPICINECQNGGSCVRPNTCSCVKGFSGKFCEVNENPCETEKPCDQICVNTFLSSHTPTFSFSTLYSVASKGYRCECREKFKLKSDGTSCELDTAVEELGGESKDMEETDDLENKVSILENAVKKLESVDEISARKTNEQFEIFKSELAKFNDDLKKVDSYSEDIIWLKNRVGYFEKYFEDNKKLSYRQLL